MRWQSVVRDKIHVSTTVSHECPVINVAPRKLPSPFVPLQSKHERSFLLQSRTRSQFQTPRGRFHKANKLQEMRRVSLIRHTRVLHLSTSDLSTGQLRRSNGRDSWDFFFCVFIVLSSMKVRIIDAVWLAKKGYNNFARKCIELFFSSFLDLHSAPGTSSIDEPWRISCCFIGQPISCEIIDPLNRTRHHSRPNDFCTHFCATVSSAVPYFCLRSPPRIIGHPTFVAL